MRSSCADAIDAASVALQNDVKRQGERLERARTIGLIASRDERLVPLEHPRFTH